MSTRGSPSLYPRRVTEPPVIRSAANPVVKRVRRALGGRESGVLVLEGDRLIADALARGLELDELLIAESRPREVARALEQGHAVRVVDDELLARLSRLETSPGALALARAPEAIGLDRLRGAPDALVAVVAGVADPGNLGAIARTAEAAGASALVVAAGGCSPWNEKALRGSMGSLLRLPVATTDGAPRELAATLAEAGYRNVRAATRGGVALEAFDWSGRVALWLTAETGELEVDAAAFDAVTIPMAAGVESLNVGAAAAVLLFAAGRNAGGST